MKTFRELGLVFVLLLAVSGSAPAQGTAFTYQGRLNNNGGLASGIYDFTFALYGSVSNADQTSPTLTISAVSVTNGVFTAVLDFGPNIFNGSNSWLQVGVRTNNATVFTPLSPRQPITPTPNAIFANSASNLLGTVTPSQISGTYSNSVNFSNAGNNFSGTFSGSGSNLTGVVAASTQSLTGNAALLALGNAKMGMPVPIYEASAYTVASGANNPSPGTYKGPALCFNRWIDDGNVSGAEIETGGSYGTVGGFLSTVNLVYNSPLYKLGFDTIVIDGGWVGYRDAQGNIHENADVWPDGISNCVKYAHSLGLKVGLWCTLAAPTNLVGSGGNYEQCWQPQYTNPTTQQIFWLGNTNVNQLNPPNGLTIAQLAQMDATTFANWGLDYLKWEAGPTEGVTDSDVQQAAEIMVNTGNQLGHPFYIMSAVGNTRADAWRKGLINAQRCGCYDMLNSGAGYTACFNRYMSNFLFAVPLWTQSGPGSYVSLDIIPDASADWTNEITSMQIMAAALSGEICTPGPSPGFVPNQNIIDIDQDSGAVMAQCIYTNGNFTLWQKPLKDSTPGASFLMWLNADNSAVASFTITNLSQLGYSSPQMYCLDVTSNVTFTISNNWTLKIPPITAMGFKLMPVTQSLNNTSSGWLQPAPYLVTVTSNYYMTGLENVVLVTTNALIALPVAPVAGKIYWIKAASISQPGSISPPAGMTIDGSAKSLTLNAWSSYGLTSDGTNYFLLKE